MTTIICVLYRSMSGKHSESIETALNAMTDMAPSPPHCLLQRSNPIMCSRVNYIVFIFSFIFASCYSSYIVLYCLYCKKELDMIVTFSCIVCMYTTDTKNSKHSKKLNEYIYYTRKLVQAIR